MKIAVLSNKEQYKALLESGLNLNEIKIFCDNPSFYDFLEHGKINFIPLREEDIKDSWTDIDTWACEKALLWGELIKDRKFFFGMEMEKVLFVYFSYYLATLLKNFHFADLIYKEYNPSGVVSFANVMCPEFPAANGNYFLNIFLRDLGRSSGIKIFVFDSKVRTEKKKNPALRENIRKVLQEVYSKIFSPVIKTKVFMACGGLGHMAEVLKKLNKESREIIFYDFDFRLKNFKFCLKNRISYLIPNHFSKTKTEAKENKFDFENDFKKSVAILRAHKWFTYKGVDLSNYVCEELLNHSREYLANMSLWARTYSSLINNFAIAGLVVNEDLSPRGAFMAEFFKSKNVKIFCVSHGYGPIRFSLPQESRKFFISRTFVHSEFEKTLYSARGWNPGHLQVTGVPRYDRLAKLRQIKMRDNRKTNRMKILFCGALMIDYAPDQIMFNDYMGLHQNIVGQHMRACLNDIVEAINDYNIELIIKPHYNDDEDLWRDFVVKNRKKDNIKLISAKTDFFNLLMQCNAMLIGHWSTAIIEAAIINIPTVVIDYSGLDDAHPFAKENLCSVIHSQSQLRDSIKKMYLAFRENGAFKNYPAYTSDKVFYLGINDGMNTGRVLKNILYEIDGKGEEHEK